jgi:predicted thioesterase
MKSTLAAGLTFQRTFTVDAERCISFMGDAARVYATPSMVRDIEMTCRDFLLEHRDPGEDSVGTRIEVDHLAATPLGMRVTVSGTVVEVKGRAVTFDIAVHDTLEQVGRGRHFRFVVDVARTGERLVAKRQKAGL